VNVSESSVLFSLRELARMEDDRAREQAEAAERRRALEHEKRLRSQREQLAREQAEAQEREELGRRAQERAREEEARLQAIHNAAVEAARIESEARIRARERERERNHEVEVERARGQARRVRLQTGLQGFVVGLFVTLAASGAIYVGAVAPRDKSQVDALRARVDSTEAALRASGAKEEAAEQGLRALQAEGASLRNDRDRLQSELDDARRLLSHRSNTVRGGPTGTRSPGDHPKLDGFTTCPPGSKDPLCLQ
jgi:colicin import membrane protein